MSQDKHTVKSHIWRNGMLTVFTEYFENFADALNYSRQSGAHTTKVFAPNGDLMHSASSNAAETEQTYA